jgi:hypothetical protein
MSDLMTMHSFFWHPTAVRALTMMPAFPFLNRHFRQRKRDWNTFGIADDEVGAGLLCCDTAVQID